MNTPPKSITRQHPRPPINTTSISIQTVESSVQGLVKSWYRREKWKLFFHSRSEIDDLAIKRAAWRTHLSKILESTPARVKINSPSRGARRLLLPAARVVESAFELSDEAIEAQIEGTVLQFEALREENAKLMETIAEKDEIIEKLQEIIEKITCNH
ncbi:hypothetical protein Tsubulata_036986 [Turnera subulata]|uniref:Uncharacterized protein n=1 Tax=Turnera subulata TaxID=218843 RepID=A0A9Q0JDZ4_9ROSI|nr:hypothetical protein Tsubulata_036986 [Turnera subulata]